MSGPAPPKRSSPSAKTEWKYCLGEVTGDVWSRTEGKEASDRDRVEAPRACPNASAHRDWVRDHMGGGESLARVAELLDDIGFVGGVDDRTRLITDKLSSASE